MHKYIIYNIYINIYLYIYIYIYIYLHVIPFFEDEPMNLTLNHPLESYTFNGRLKLSYQWKDIKYIYSYLDKNYHYSGC